MNVMQLVCALSTFPSTPDHWAFSEPVRKVYYNLTITGLSTAVAFLIGTIELVGILRSEMFVVFGCVVLFGSNFRIIRARRCGCHRVVPGSMTTSVSMQGPVRSANQRVGASAGAGARDLLASGQEGDAAAWAAAAWMGSVFRQRGVQA
ncbi:HoxN/HupN/NixA family nickel/cobalt transporter [Nocardia sp. NPDC004123]